MGHFRSYCYARTAMLSSSAATSMRGARASAWISPSQHATIAPIDITKTAIIRDVIVRPGASKDDPALRGYWDTRNQQKGKVRFGANRKEKHQSRSRDHLPATLRSCGDACTMSVRLQPTQWAPSPRIGSS
jgi:hypothetical protein